MSLDNTSGVLWYLARDGQHHGPITDAELKKLAELSYLRPNDLIWREGLQGWLEVNRVPGLLAGHAPLPPLPPPASINSQAPFAQPAWQATPSQFQLPAANSALDTAGWHAAPTATTVEPSAPAYGHAPPSHQGRRDDTTTGLAMAAYVLLLIPIPPLPLIGMIIAAVNSGKDDGWITTHYRWQWRTFLKSVPFAFVGLATAFIGIGALILLVLLVWYIVRIVKGISAMNAGQPIDNYRTWGWTITTARASGIIT